MTLRKRAGARHGHALLFAVVCAMLAAASEASDKLVLCDFDKPDELPWQVRDYANVEPEMVYRGSVLFVTMPRRDDIRDGWGITTNVVSERVYRYLKIKLRTELNEPATVEIRTDGPSRSRRVANYKSTNGVWAVWCIPLNGEKLRGVHIGFTERSGKDHNEKGSATYELDRIWLSD